jgi:hypothetical protein
MKRRVWIVGLVTLALPLCVAYGAIRSRCTPARVLTATARKQARPGVGKPRRASAHPSGLTRRPHPCLLLGARIAGHLSTGGDESRTASATNLRATRSGA